MNAPWRQHGRRPPPPSTAGASVAHPRSRSPAGAAGTGCSSASRTRLAARSRGLPAAAHPRGGTGARRQTRTRPAGGNGPACVQPRLADPSPIAESFSHLAERASPVGTPNYRRQAQHGPSMARAVLPAARSTAHLAQQDDLAPGTGHALPFQRAGQTMPSRMARTTMGGHER